MSLLVADTSGLLSLGTVAAEPNAPFDATVAHYDVVVPELVVSELEATAAYDDAHGEAAAAMLGRLDDVTVVETMLEESFPLDDGENAAVTAANTRAAALLLCDEFVALPLVHASLEAPRLVTTPTFLRVLHGRGVYSATEARELLTRIGDVRSWGENAYVQRVRESL